MRTKDTPFIKDCIIDLSSPPLSYEKTKLENLVNNKTIVIKGQLSENYIRSIYNKLRSSPYYSYITTLDIYDSINIMTGITGLKKPKKR